MFDGHGGPEVSIYVSRHIVDELVHDSAYKQKNYGQALTNCFKKIDEKLNSPKGE